MILVTLSATSSEHDGRVLRTSVQRMREPRRRHVTFYGSLATSIPATLFVKAVPKAQVKNEGTVT